MKKDFSEIQLRFDKENIKKKEFLTKAIPYLQSITSNNTLDSLVYLFKDEEIPSNLMVTEEDGPILNHKIYVLYEGTCKVEKRFSVDNQNFPLEITLNICEIGKENKRG